MAEYPKERTTRRAPGVDTCSACSRNREDTSDVDGQVWKRWPAEQQKVRSGRMCNFYLGADGDHQVVSKKLR